MNITLFSFIMAMLWCDIIAVITYFLMRKQSFVLKNITIYSVLCLAVFGALRMICSFEYEGAVIINSYKILPAVRDFLDWIPFHNVSALSHIRIKHIFFMVWGIGTLIYLGVLVYGYFRFKRLILSEQEVDDEDILQMMNEISGGKADKVRIICTSAINVPLITGLIKPVICLPDIEFSYDELYNTLLHEWQHYLHKDLWLKTVIEVVCALYWWNPVIYFIRNNINNTLEIKSDLNAVKRFDETEKDTYLNCIVRIMSKIQKTKPEYKYNRIMLGFTTERIKGRPMRQRFKYVIESEKSKFFRRFGIAAFFASMFITLIMSYVFIIQSAGYPPGASPEEIESGKSGYFCEDTIDKYIDTSYLVKEADGVYSLYINDHYYGYLEDPYNDKMFSKLKIYKREELK